MHHESASFPKKRVFASPKWIAGAGRKTTEVKGWGSKVLVWRLGLGWGQAKRYDLGRTSWWCFHKCRNREEWLGHGTVRTMYCLLEAFWLAAVQIYRIMSDLKKWTDPKWMFWTMNCLRITLCIAKFAFNFVRFHLHVCIPCDNDAICPVSYIDARIESGMLLTCAMQDSIQGRPRDARQCMNHEYSAFEHAKNIWNPYVYRQH